MKSIFVLLALIFFANGVFAAEDPRFTWEMAKREYYNAQKPSTAEINGVWLYVGSAMEGDTKYYPDGKYNYDKNIEANYLTTITDSGKDKGGIQRYHLQTKVVLLVDGAEKNIDEYEGFEAATFARFLFSKYEYNKKQNRVSCEVHQDCRMTGDQKYLICAFVTTKDSGCVRHWPSPYAYRLLMRK